MDPEKLHRLVRQTSLAQSLDACAHVATLTNASDEFVYANPSFTRMYGWREEELIGLKPVVLVPANYSHGKLACIRRKIFEQQTCWMGQMANRHKDGGLFDVELATFQIGLAEGLPANLALGVAAPVGQLKRAVNELAACMCRALFQHRVSAINGFERMKRHERVKALADHGYTMKEIATFLGVDLNTPYVILHRAKKLRKNP